MSTPIQDLRYAGRTLLKSPGFTASAVLTLALGIGANAAVFSVVQGVLLAPLEYPNAHRLVRIWSSHPERGLDFFSVSVADYLDWQEAPTRFQSLAAYEDERGLTLVVRDGRPEEVFVARVTPDLFAVLGTPPLLGRRLSSEDLRGEEARVAVLSHDFWQSRLGGDPGAVGRTLMLDGEPHAVVGVMPASFTVPGNSAVMWTPLDVRRTDLASVRGARFLDVLARLAPGADVAQARQELDAVAERLAAEYPASNNGWTVNLLPLRDVVVGEDFRLAILVVFGAVGLVLFIACANVANLTLVRAAGRHRELALRAALGASRRRLVLLLLGETTLLALLAAGLALPVAAWGVDLLPRLGETSVPWLDAIRVDAGVLAFTSGVSCVVVLLTGLIPAFTATRGGAHEGLNAGTRGTLRGPIGRRARRIVVIGQLGLATMLVAGAALLVRSFVNLREVDLGFEPRQVLTAQLHLAEERYAEPAQAVAFYHRLLEGLRALSGVTVAGAVTSVPFGPGNPGDLFAPDGAAIAREGAPDTDYRKIAGDYFRVMDIQLLAGRTFDATDEGGAQSVIVSRTLAERFWPGESPVGRRIRFSDPWQGPLFTIVGVVEDARYRGLDEPTVRPMMYFPHAVAGDAVRAEAGSMTLVLRSDGDPLALVEPLRAQLARLDRNQPIGTIQPMTAVLDDVLADRRFNTFLLTCFAGLALLLAAVGAYAVLAYMVSQRRRDLAVRMALGARRRDVAMSVLRDGLLTAAAGVGAGVLATLVATRLLAGLLYGVRAHDPATLGGVGTLLLLVAAAASYVPAHRAARVDPMEVLRGE